MKTAPVDMRRSFTAWIRVVEVDAIFSGERFEEMKERAWCVCWWWGVGW